MENNKELNGKVAIITGAARNMGRAFAIRLAQNGANIVIHYHSESSKADAMETLRLVEKAGAKAINVSGDISDVSEVKHLFDETVKAFDRVDIVINNAGKVIKKPLTEITEEDFDSSFGINTKAAFFIMQEAAKRMENNGRIINIGTTILGATIPFYSVYAGSKSPLEDFTRALAKEIGNRGITVNTIAPGPIDTPFYHDQESPESVARASQAGVAGRLGKPEDIVPITEFLASSKSQWVTAQTIFVNGG